MHWIFMEFNGSMFFYCLLAMRGRYRLLKIRVDLKLSTRWKGDSGIQWHLWFRHFIIREEMLHFGWKVFRGKGRMHLPHHLLYDFTYLINHLISIINSGSMFLEGWINAMCQRMIYGYYDHYLGKWENIL